MWLAENVLTLALSPLSRWFLSKRKFTFYVRIPRRVGLLASSVQTVVSDV